MELSFCDLSSIPCPTLVRVITNLDRAELRGCMLWENKLDIEYNSMTPVPPTI